MGRRTLLLFLWTVLALTFTSSFAHARLSVLVRVSALYDWGECLPDFTLQLDQDTLREAAMSAKSDATKKVLACVGAPFIVHLDHRKQMQCLLEVLLLKDPHKGVCPSPYGSPLIFLLQACFPAVLRQRYGVERLNGLGRLGLSEAWGVGRNGPAPASPPAVSDPTRQAAAEAFIAALPSPNPPGMILIKRPLRVGGERGAGAGPPHAFYIPLADIRLTAGPSRDLWWVHFDYTEPRQRLLRQWAIQTRGDHGRAAAQRGAMVMRSKLRPLKQRLSQEVDVSLLLHSPKWRPQAQGLEVSEPLAHKRRQKLFKPPTEAYCPGKQTNRSSGAAILKGSFTCMKLTRAWQTLRAQQVSDSDTRLMQLRRELGRYHCHRDANDGTIVEKKDEEICLNLCQALRETREWGRRTGQPLTTAQSFSIFSSLFVKNLTPAAPMPSFTHRWGVYSPQRNDNFDSEGFVNQTLDFIHRQSYQLCGCDVSRQEQGEFLYLASLLQLLQLPRSTNATPQACASGECWNLPSPRVVVDLYQAMWYESPHATAALATLREHGILIKQHQKAALPLLLRSMRGKSSFMFRQLFFHRKRNDNAAAQKTDSKGVSNTSSLEELLVRQERLYAVLNSFGSLNYPVISQKSVDSLLLTNNQESGNIDEFNTREEATDILSEEEDSEVASGREAGRLASQAARQLTKATLFMVSYKGVKQDLIEAECQLLSILRKFGYICDVELLSSMELSEEGETLWYHRSRLYKGICEEHTLELRIILSNPARPRIRCPAWLQENRKDVAKPVTLLIPRMKKNYKILQQTLTLLSYLYLLEKQNYELVAAYASLSVQLSAAAHEVAYADLRPKVLYQLSEMSRLQRQPSDGRQANTQSESHQFNSKNLHRQLKKWGEKKLVEVVGTKLPYEVFKSKTPPLSLVDSPVASIGQEMVLLAVCALLDETVKSRKLISFSPSEMLGPIQMSASMWHVNNLFLHVFRVPSSRTRHEAASLMLLTAMNQWEKTQFHVNVLDQCYLSAHTIDSFVLMTWVLNDYSEMLRMHARGTESQLSDESLFLKELLHLALTRYRGLVGRRRKFLPRPDDTIRFYSRRLLSFSVQNVRGCESAEELLFGGLAAPINTPDELAPRRTALQVLRNGKQRELDRTQLFPLLYASDTHEYLSATNWTVFERFFDTALNAFYYLFAETTEETLLRRMGLEILSPPRDVLSQDSDLTESPAGFVLTFLELFAASYAVRELNVATLLLAATLASGDPTGFALMFWEAGERHNAFLLPFVDYLAQEVWDDATTARMWSEHHAVAQWHRVKKRVRGHSNVLSLDGHSPFRYATPEPRQELMAAVDRWHTKRLLQRVAAAASNSSQAQSNLQRGRRDAESILLRCTSHILYSLALGGQNYPNGPRAAALPHTTAATQKGGGTGCDSENLLWLEKIPSTLYDGMLFPAGNPQCALDLYSLLEQAYGDCFTDQMRYNFMASVVGNLTDRLAYYYNLTANPLSKDVLLHSSTNLEGDGLHNESGLNKEKDGTNVSANKVSYDSTINREFLVEPWNRIGVALGEEMPISLERGEGSLYNLRLHRLSGIQWGVKALSLWCKVKSWIK